MILFASSRAAAQDLGVPAAAAEAIDINDWSTVAQLLESHVSSNPSEPISYWYGVAQFELGNRNGAVEHLRRAAAANPRSLACAQYLARCAASSNDTAALDALAVSFPTDAEISMLAGNAWMARFFPAKANAKAEFFFLAPEPSEYMKNAMGARRRDGRQYCFAGDNQAALGEWPHPDTR